jgi:NADPH:quinone reductase-like Zn-dependent oxidoreductase
MVLPPFLTKWNRQDLHVVKDLIEAGKVTPVIDRTYPLSEAREAMRHLEEGQAPGEDHHHGMRRVPAGASDGLGR